MMAEGPERQGVLEYRVAFLENAIGDIRDSLKTLATVEIRHAETREALTRAFSQIDGLVLRIGAIETSMPVLNLTSGWVRTGVICLCGLVMVAVVKLVVGP